MHPGNGFHAGCSSQYFFSVPENRNQLLREILQIRPWRSTKPLTINHPLSKDGKFAVQRTERRGARTKGSDVPKFAIPSVSRF
jgi:hypothetical protein